MSIKNRGTFRQPQRRGCFLLCPEISKEVPRELSLEDNQQLLLQYCQEQFVSKGMIADVALHDDHDGNPHAHVLLTMRPMDENGQVAAQGTEGL